MESHDVRAFNDKLFFAILRLPPNFTKSFAILAMSKQVLMFKCV